MSFLPIVERELRVTSRRSITYYSRIAAAAVGMMIVMSILWQSRSMPPGAAGKALFSSLSSIAMLFCMFGGIRFTADSLSEERREGTLGLLFLTDLKGSDIVFGKLAASSLNLVYGVVALIPILWISIMLGGVTLGESGRISLSLINALWLSLSVGTWTSARSRSDQKSMWTSAVFLGSITGFPFLFDLMLNRGAFVPTNALLAFVSPVYSIVLANETTYLSAPSLFWITLATVHGGAWLFLLSACRSVSRFRQDETDDTGTSLWNRWDRWSRGIGKQPGNRRARLLDKNPILWIKSRSRRDRAWALAILGSLGFCVLAIPSQPNPSPGLAGHSILLQIGESILSFVLLILTASGASRFFAEGRRTQSLELLLTTALPDSAFIKGQSAALARDVLLAVILLSIWKLAVLAGIMISAAGSTMPMNLTASFQIEYWQYFLFSSVTGLLTLTTDLFALVWVGMWFGLSARKPAFAATLTFIAVLVVPSILFIPFSILIGSMSAGFSYFSGFLLIPALTIVKDVCFVAWAYGKLSSDLRTSLTRSISAKN